MQASSLHPQKRKRSHVIQLSCGLKWQNFFQPHSENANKKNLLSLGILNMQTFLYVQLLPCVAGIVTELVLHVAAGAEYQQVSPTEAELSDEGDKDQERQRKKKSLADRVKKLSTSLGILPSSKDSTVSLSGFFKSVEGEKEEAQILMDVMEEEEEEEIKIIGQA